MQVIGDWIERSVDHLPYPKPRAYGSGRPILSWSAGKSNGSGAAIPVWRINSLTRPYMVPPVLAARLVPYIFRIMCCQASVGACLTLGRR